MLLLFGLAWLSVVELRLAIIAQTAYSSKAAQKAVKSYQQEPRLLVDYGKEDILNGDLQTARSQYQKALRVNPFYVPAWIALSELENDQGNTVQAVAILDYLDGIMQDVLRWRWEKIMLAYLLGRKEMVRTDLAWLLRQEATLESTREKAAKLAFSLWPDPKELLRSMGRENSVQLFQQAVKAKQVAIASALWSEAERVHAEEITLLSYIDLLIHSEKTKEAAAIWRKYYPSASDSLLHNGDFSQPLLGRGFDWNLLKVEGAATEQLLGKRDPPMLHLRFTGGMNVDYYHANQLVYLQPGQEFVLSGEMRSRGLTTDQKPFVAITDRNYKMIAASEMAAADQDWKTFALTFAMPKECGQGAVVFIRRLQSHKIDNLISGDFWIRNLSLKQASRSGR